MRIYTYLFLFLFAILTSPLWGQGTQTEFGKNRVQYHEDFKEWLTYESQNFITYWYGKSRNVGQATVQLAEYDFDAIQNILEHRINDKMEIIVYADITDMKQSNIGSEEAFVNTGGQTKIVGSKIFVYFNGDHNDLRRQIREGIASVYLNSLLFGSNLQEIVQNAVMMNLPTWFKQGLISYTGISWSTELDNQLRDIVLSDKYDDFDEIAEDHPKLAGHALWYFISQNYGKSTVSNLLYLTRINRSIESGFLYVLGSSYRKTTDSWMLYFKQRYKSEIKGMAKPGKKPLAIKNKRKLPLSNLKISPDGKKIAYVSNEIGKTKVYIQDIKTGKRTMVLKEGFRNAFQATDYVYPLLSWNPNNQDLAIIYERRDIIKLLLYNTITSERITEDMSTQYQRIFSMDYINPNDMVLSAAVSGQSDIFIYQTRTRQTIRVTNDFYDDLDAAYVEVDSTKGILFSSNRLDSMATKQKLDSILPINTFDIYFYDLNTKSTKLTQVTYTPLANERHPVAVDSSYFSYLSDKSGIYNRQMAYLKDVIAYYEQVITLNDGTEIILHQDSSLAKLDTSLIDTIALRPYIVKKAFKHNNSNYHRNILEHHTAPRVDKLVEAVYENGKTNFYIKDLNPNEHVMAKMTRHVEQRRQIERSGDLGKEEESGTTNILVEINGKAIDANTLPPEKQDTSSIDIDNYLFQSEFDDKETPATVLQEEEDGNIKIQQTKEVLDYESALSTIASVEPDDSRSVRFRPARIVPYRLKFRTDFVTTQLDNSLLFGGLDSYAGTKQEFNTPAPGILLKTNFKDLFEDYEVEGGIRLPTTFNGAEYFLIFDDKKKRLDKRYAFYRKALKLTEENSNFNIPGKVKETTHIALAQFKYPLSIFKSIRATGTIRFDKSTQLATDVIALNAPSTRQQRLGLRVEYVFDNTLDVAINIKNGTRYKFFAEALKRFEIDLIDNFSLGFNKGFMTTIGLDARHYQRLDKLSILAFRFAGATSFGSERILFFLGGTDNWLFPGFNNEIPFPVADDFAFQTLAASMRGFKQNIRNGASYALFNAELRVPLFRYFSKRIRSSFLRNFQMVGFFDVGTAWQGFSPFSGDDPLNTTIISDPLNPVTVRVNYFRDPIVMGYGAGIRSVLFGYFVRLDYAWGIETRVVQDPILYLSLGMDF